MTKNNKILGFLNQNLPFLDSKESKLQLIGFTSLYTIIFLYVFVPFNLDDWGDNSLGYIAIGTSVILCSQFVLRPLFGFRKLKAYSLIIIFLIELLATTYIIFLIYGPIFPSFTEKVQEYLMTLKHTSLIICVPYFLFVGYLNLRYKMSSYKEADNTKIQSAADSNNELLTIKGENNKTVIAIKYHQLLFVKSAGNYLELFYLVGEKTAKELVRGKLKEFEESISHQNVIRVHRSYMINAEHISSYKKTRKGYAILMDNFPDTEVPVSSGFKSFFEEAVQKTPH